MKKTAQLILFALTFTSTLVFAQSKEVRNVDKFTKIENSSSGNVYLKQGSPQKIEIDASKEILANVVTEVSGGKLKIGMKNHHSSWGWSDEEKCNIYITVEHIDAIDMHGSGNLIAQTPLTGATIDFSLSGSGELEAEVALTGDLNLDISGSGDVKLKGKSQNIKSDISGSGDADLSLMVANQADFEISGSGEIKASGMAPVMMASISGSGSLEARNFVTDKSKVRVSGSGDAAVNVKNDLDAKSSGSGEISYKGNPAKVNSHNSGSGSVTKMD
jgi:hypothetical protein